jgi:thioester reductase-like protein
MRSVLGTLETWVDRHPDKLLYSFLDSNGEAVERHSYGTFLDRINLIASHLICRGRFQHGDRVLLVYPPGLEMIAALFACARAGVISVPVPPPSAYGFTAAVYRMRHIAQDCGAVAVLTSRDCEALLRRHIEANGENGDALASRPVTDFKWIVTDDLVEPVRSGPNGNPVGVFFLQYTSGSTSSPKGVIVTHDNVLHNCSLAVDHEAPVTVSWLPQHHDMGLLGYYIYIALTGGTTYGFSPTTFIQRPSLWLETITKYCATASSAPNFAYECCLRPGRLSEATLRGLNLSSLRYLMAAAEPIRPDTYRRFLQKFERHGLKPESFFVAYGLAENTLAVTNYGRATISVSKRKLAAGVVEPTRELSGVGVAMHLMSCGKPLAGNTVRIVDPERRIAVAEGKVGEIWIHGPSKCPGYWNNPELTHESFCARIEGEAEERAEYLRTGDMGFFHDGELYVCGRRKDMIIVHGQNFFPQDIETVVERASPLVRHGCVAAFELDDRREPTVAVVAEVSSSKAVPDARVIATSIRDHLGIDAGLIAFVPPKAIPRTSSGKIMRYMVKQMWLAGQLNVVSQLVQERGGDEVDDPSDHVLSPFEFLKRRYQLTGDEPHSLIDVGMDSIDLVVFLHELKELLEARGASDLSRQVDFRLIQRVSVADFFRLVEKFERAPEVAINRFRRRLAGIREKHRAEERALMLKDRTFTAPSARAARSTGPSTSTPPETPRVVLLTGGTGFLGPFLLRSLLEQTDATIHVLIRAASVDEARDRLGAALHRAVAPCASLSAELDARVVPVNGDLERPGLGLSKEVWHALAQDVDTIYHNAATVNYLFNYAAMRGANVGGSQEVLRLAFDGHPKQVNHISTTFIFGWTTKPVLYETDANGDMDRLDFGYSQTKWVAEQKVLDAARYGLGTRIFRPSLITPSVTGGGNIDITIRLLAFMIKHGIGVDTLNQVSFVPADVAANNIVAIANQSRTVGGTFHVTRDEYVNMVDVTNIISACTGRRFDLFPLRDFVPEVIRRCTRDDLLFPLLDFLVGSVDNISAMESKRYDNSSYQQARNASAWGAPDPSLDVTVRGILSFMARNGIA